MEDSQNEIEVEDYSGGNVYSIARIKVSKLFGKYDYELDVADGHHSKNLRILYGDNGVGKTTIMKILFHMMSTADNRAHRTYLASTPFEEFRVDFSDGSFVKVHRSDGSLEDFTYSLSRNGEIATCAFTLDKLRRDEKKWQVFLKKLGSFQLRLFYLGDDRSLTSDSISVSEDEYVRIFSSDSYAPVDRRERVDRRDITLKNAMGRTSQWALNQVIRGSREGAANVHQLYQVIIERLITPQSKTEEVVDAAWSDLIQSLNVIGKRSTMFALYGITEALDFSTIISALQSASADRRGTITTVLRPYVEGLNAHLDALQRTWDAISVFVNTANDFLFDKKIEFNVRNGLKVVSTGGSLSSSMLSSGEKHLLLLLCTTLSTRGLPCLYLIDEPEISLNVKWQRKLIDALLRCSGGGNTFFVMSTHSIELLTQYENYVLPVEPILAIVDKNVPS